jgi:DNA mismatch repair protein MutL
VGRIQTLPTSVINRIAAGEVVERPASVVKELLENALDAGPSQIDVTIEQGGIALVRVVDDGCGIEPEDLPLAIQPHATSKLRVAEDLDQIATLGFRGEALASIAEVSRLLIRSRTETGAGSRLEVDGGVNNGVAPEGCGRGTSVEVHQLFSRVPARRAFLRTPATEWSHSAEAFVRTALAHPGVGFSLTHNRRRVHELGATESWRRRIGDLFGRQLADRLLEATETDDDVTVTAVVGRPEDDLPSGRLQHFFVGCRPFRDRSILHAVQEGYRGRLLAGRQPIVFLRLDVPPLSVDVNVHPAKMEVRFRDPGRLHRLVLAAIRRALLGLDTPTALRPPGITQDLAAPSEQPAAAGLAAAEAIWQRQLSTDRLSPSNAVGDELGPTEPVPPPPTLAKWERDEATRQEQLPLPASTGDSGQPPSERSFQLHDRYLVVETAGGIEVIDQHALHERVLYEQLRERLASGSLEVQPLLIPEQIDLSPAAYELVERYAGLLAEAGVRVEAFGGSTVVVRSKPALVGRTPAAAIIAEIVDRLVTLAAAGGDRRVVVDEVLHSLSCRAAIKAGDPLSQPEVDRLVADRHRYPSARHCPHGRPTSLLLSRQELDRQFRRT